MPHYHWVGVKVQDPHVASTATNMGWRRECYHLTEMEVLALRCIFSDTILAGERIG